MNLGRGLVDEVYGLVREEAVRDVARREAGRRGQRLVGDGDVVVGGVALAQALEYGDGLLHRRLVDENRLEAALQRGVLLDVLAVLVERGRAHGLQLAPRQRRLEDVGRVDGALRGAGADQRVHLVDEEDDVAALDDLVDDALEALLEFAAELRPGDEAGEVELYHLLLGQHLGDLAAGDGLRQALDDSGLAHARVADEDRVVLGAARQDLDAALDLLVAAYHRVQLTLPRQHRQVPAEGVQRRRLGLRVRAVRPRRRRAHKLVALVRDHLGVGAQRHQDLDAAAGGLVEHAQ